MRPRAVQQGVAVSRLSEEARSADDAGAPPARLRAGRSDKATRRPLDRRRALASLRESGRRASTPRVPSTQSSSPIVWVSRPGAARMAAQDVSRLSDRGSERSRGRFGPARTCRCRGFLYFLPTIWKRLPQ